jgi:hypothetical protein
MMTSTIIGLFDNPTQAEQARSEIVALSIPSVDVQVYDNAGFQLTGGTDTSTRGFWKSLSETLAFGPANQAMYQEGVRRGGTIVSVRADDGQIDNIADILNRCGAVDLDTRAAEWQAGGWTSLTGQPHSIPDMAVSGESDKREMKRGGVRVYRHASSGR